MLPPGQSVRVIANAHSVSGSVQAAANDLMTIGTGNTSQIFEHQEIKRVSVKEQSHWLPAGGWHDIYKQ